MSGEKWVPPTFDQWYANQHMGFSFAAQHMQPNHTFERALRALAKETADYISWVAEQMVKKS